MKKNNKGFTLAELLIVVAIIAVLVAISIPIFSTQLEKAREATDMANIRSAYAEVVTQYLTNDTSHEAKVTATQKQSNWQMYGNATSASLNERVNGVETVVSVPALITGQYTVSIDASGSVTVN